MIDHKAEIKKLDGRIEERIECGYSDHEAKEIAALIEIKGWHKCKMAEEIAGEAMVAGVAGAAGAAVAHYGLG